MNELIINIVRFEEAPSSQPCGMGKSLIRTGTFPELNRQKLAFGRISKIPPGHLKLFLSNTATPTGLRRLFVLPPFWSLVYGSPIHLKRHWTCCFRVAASAASSILRELSSVLSRPPLFLRRLCHNACDVFTRNAQRFLSLNRPHSFPMCRRSSP